MKTITTSSSRVDLPKSWKGSKVIVQFPNEDTLLAKRVPTESEQEIDFEVDERIWDKIEPTARKVRDRVFKEFYPSLYAASKRSSRKTP